MELKNKITANDKAFILGAAVTALTGKQTLIPTTARFDIVNCYQRLRMHPNLLMIFPLGLVCW